MIRSLPLAAALLLAGCYASNVVATADRVVVADTATLAWQPAQASDVPGLYESIRIEGDAAFALRKVYYWFDGDGRYAGAALIAGDDGLTFQTLNGTWQLTAAGFVLDAAPAARLQSAPDHLRLEANHGVLVLHRTRVN